MIKIIKFIIINTIISNCYANSLRTIELQISKIATDLNSIKQNTEKQKQRLNELDRSSTLLKKNINADNKQLEKLLIATYKAPKSLPLQKLLNTRNLPQFSRISKYQSIIYAQQIDLLSSNKKQLAKLEHLSKQKQQQIAALEDNKKLMSKKQSELKQQLSKRQELLTKQTKPQNFAEVKLKNSKTIKTKRYLTKLYSPIRNFKHILKLGTMVKANRFVLPANMGESVSAVQHGKVIFSDWLKGYGLLMIIEHDSGIMSLYGHNQALLKSVGDVVSSGEKIALVGQSGGQANPGLYFEIREQGESQDLQRLVRNGTFI